MNHDVVVIGGSAGSVEVLLKLVSDLPANLAASLFVVVHMGPTAGNPLPELLSSHGPLPASYPLHQQAIERGHIYVAPPDNHLLLRPGSVEVVRGPKVNGHRPAADALFRSASAAYGPRAIGVVLSGYQDCGTAGMMSIHARGGISIAQSPESSLAAEMPRSVIDKAQVDHVVEPSELAALLTRLVDSSVRPKGTLAPVIKQLEGSELGTAAELVCPACSGVLTEATAGEFHHFRCHVGHAFTLPALVREQAESLERAMWESVRALEESASLSRRLSVTESGEMRRTFTERAHTFTEQAELIRRFLLRGNALAEAAVS